MAAVTREQVMSALLSKASGAAGFMFVSRHIDLLPDSSTPTVATPPAQPALYLFEDHEFFEYTGRGTPPARTWFVVLWVWCQSPKGSTPGVADGVTPGMTTINGLIEAIEAVFKPDNFETNEMTLGGLVKYARIDGTVVKVSGDMNPDGQCVAMIPVKILVP